MKQAFKCFWTILLIMLFIIQFPIDANAAKQSVVSISNEKPLEIDVGSEGTLTMTIDSKKNPAQQVSYTSSNTKVATITSKGVLKGIKVGIANIQVMLSGKVYATYKVIVKEQSISQVNLSCEQEYLYMGESETLKAEIIPRKVSNKSLSFQSSNSNIVSVSKKGVITARKLGKATMTATSRNKIKGTIVIHVIEKPLLTVRGKSLALGDTEKNVKTKFGTPGYKGVSLYGDFVWIYNDDYSKFLMIYMENNKTVGFYTDSLDFKIAASTKNNRYNFKEYIDEIGTNLRTGVRVLDKKLVTHPINSVMNSMEKQIFELTNSIRVRNKISPLLWSELAAKSAKSHSLDMEKNGYFSHADLNGNSSADRMRAVGIDYNGCGENIIAGYGDAVDSVQGWFQSQGHRDNMLSSNFQYLGVGGAAGKGKNYSEYYTQNFYN